MKLFRLLAFILIVGLSFTLFAFTTEPLVNKLKLGLDLKGGFEILYEATPIDPSLPLNKESLNQTAKSLAKRIDIATGGVAEPEIVTEGENRIRVKLAIKGDQQEVRDILKKPASLTLRSSSKDDANFDTVELFGVDFKENAAKVFFDEANLPGIEIEVKDAQKLENVTNKLLNKPLAIFLDEQLLSAPVVRAVINNGKASITGDYTVEEAKDLAETINLGALPLNLTEKYSQSVGATLGATSLQQTVYAGIIASIVILLFMIVFYRLPGFVSAITLISYIWLLILIFDLFNVTLTLPGIAAFILGIGMAVDANIITFERIKDEMRKGKSIMSAFKSGNKNSLGTILDANITTIIAGLVLWDPMGVLETTGSVKGFGFVLIMSILVSMLTNVVFSRFLLEQLIKSNLINKPGYFGVKENEINAL